MIKKKITRIALLPLAAVAVFALSFIGARVGLTSSRAAAESDDLSPAAPSIALPGYDEISLKAGQTEQEVYFYNLKSSRCFMEFSLLLDGEPLYSSDRIAPNTKIPLRRFARGHRRAALRGRGPRQRLREGRDPMGAAERHHGRHRQESGRSYRGRRARTGRGYDGAFPQERRLRANTV